jgi:hypothetical protein
LETNPLLSAPFYLITDCYKMSTYIGLTEVRRSEVLENIGNEVGLKREIGEAYGAFARRIREKIGDEAKATDIALHANNAWARRERGPGEVGPTRKHIVRNAAQPEKVLTGHELPEDPNAAILQPPSKAFTVDCESVARGESLYRDPLPETSPEENGEEAPKTSADVRTDEEKPKGTSTLLDSMTKKPDEDKD